MNGVTRVFNGPTESVVRSATAFAAIEVNSNGVSINGFTVQSSEVGIAIPPGGTGPFDIRNNIIRNNSNGIFLNSDGIPGSTVVTRNKILNNNRGIDDVSPPEFVGYGILGFLQIVGADISANYISLHREAGIIVAGCNAPSGYVTIGSNTFKNNSSAVQLFDGTVFVTIEKNTSTDDMPANDGVEGSTVIVGNNVSDVLIGRPERRRWQQLRQGSQQRNRGQRREPLSY